ncbi:MAG: regulator of sigma E protease, partial [Planctomycetota bacterium]
SGPVGIVSLVNDAQRSGLVALLLLMAVISINLALLNLVPFPALDGGRLIFVWVEAITGKKVPPKVFAMINGVGFLLLILLMVIVTINDVGGLF